MTYVPFRLSAVLRSEIVFDRRYGIALDGLLAGQMRASQAYQEELSSPSLVDGGLHASTPAEWPLPLSECVIAGPDLRHWNATNGFLVDHAGEPVDHEVRTIARLTSRFDDLRAAHIPAALTQHVPTRYGRFKAKATPVVSVPAARVVWHGVGDPDRVFSLVEPLSSVGGRRGSGHGAVIRWEIDRHSPEDVVRFAHTHPDGSLGRPIPIQCAMACHMPAFPMGTAGIRPPLFHVSNQRSLVVADMTA